MWSLSNKKEREKGNWCKKIDKMENWNRPTGKGKVSNKTIWFFLVLFCEINGSTVPRETRSVNNMVSNKEFGPVIDLQSGFFWESVIFLPRFFKHLSYCMFESVLLHWFHLQEFAFNELFLSSKNDLFDFLIAPESNKRKPWRIALVVSCSHC